MARPKKEATCRPFYGQNILKPIQVPMEKLSIVDLPLRELEALRLCDFESLDQEAASLKMKVSRATIHRLLKSGRKKLLLALLESRALRIESNDVKNRRKKNA